MHAGASLARCLERRAVRRPMISGRPRQGKPRLPLVGVGPLGLAGSSARTSKRRRRRRDQVRVDELACRPGSVSARLAATRSATIHLGLPLPTASCGLPADSGGPPSIVRADGRNHPLDLAPGGVYRAAPVTRSAGGLLHRRFTLTAAGAAAVCFLWHCPAGHPGWVLPTTLPFGARTFLGESPPRGRPASSSTAKSRGRAAFAPTRRQFARRSRRLGVRGRTAPSGWPRPPR